MSSRIASHSGHRCLPCLMLQALRPLRAKFSVVTRPIINANPLGRDEWCSAFECAGFIVEQHIPIVPELAASLFLFVDQFVHLPREAGEWFEPLTEYLRQFPAFPVEFPRVLSAIMDMERNYDDGAGFVAWLRRT